MNERNRDQRRIDNTRDELLRQRLVVNAALTKLEDGFDLLRQILDAAPFDGMASFESDVLICKDHLREITREIWKQIEEMIFTINGDAVNKNVVPASPPKANLVKIQCHLGRGNAWAEATSTHLAFYEFGPAPQFDERIGLFIPIGTDSDRERLSGSLVDLAEFYENQLSESQKY